jgi:hypothetical protein
VIFFRNFIRVAFFKGCRMDNDFIALPSVDIEPTRNRVDLPVSPDWVAPREDWLAYRRSIERLAPADHPAVHRARSDASRILRLKSGR